MDKKILVIDDDRISRKIVADYLMHAHYNVEIANGGAQAWELLNQHPELYAIVLVDRMMLGIDAMELLRRIKQSPLLQNIPVIIQTAEADPEIFVDAVTAGVFDFIYKPVDREFLLLMIENAMMEFKAKHKN